MNVPCIPAKRLKTFDFCCVDCDQLCSFLVFLFGAMVSRSMLHICEIFYLIGVVFCVATSTDTGFNLCAIRLSDREIALTELL